MTPLRAGTTIWLTSAPRLVMLQRPRRPVLAVFGRTLALVVATAAFGFTTIASAPLADQSHAAAAGRAELPVQLASAGSPGAAVKQAGLFHPRPFGAMTRFDLAEDNIPSPDTFVASAPPAEWKETEFTGVEVIDGRTLVANGTRIRLVGLDLPLPEQVCRTLDGRLEYCSARAATQLELLTRWKKVTCHYRPDGSGEAIGRCRVGTGDLTERMIRTGYTWRANDVPAKPSM